MAGSILLIGSDLRKCRRLIARLRTAGYEVDTAETIPSAWRFVLQRPPLVVVIDTSSPRDSLRPWELCRVFASCDAFLTVVLLRAYSRPARAKAFACGADQCFALNDVAVQLVRYLKAQAPQAPSRTVVMREPGEHAPREAELEIDWDNWRVYRGAQVIRLTRQEFTLLAYLARQSGRTVPHDEIHEHLWKARRPSAFRSTLKIYVRRLRQKLEPDPKHPRYLHSVRGVGYSFQTTPG